MSHGMGACAQLALLWVVPSWHGICFARPIPFYLSRPRRKFPRETPMASGFRGFCADSRNKTAGVGRILPIDSPMGNLATIVRDAFESWAVRLCVAAVVLGAVPFYFLSLATVSLAS